MHYHTMTSKVKTNSDITQQILISTQTLIVAHNIGEILGFGLIIFLTGKIKVTIK